MKEFEKWDKRQRINDLRIFDIPVVNSNQKERYKGWKAALEEVLKQLNDIYDGDFENSEIVKWIKKELGETT